MWKWVLLQLILLQCSWSVSLNMKKFESKSLFKVGVPWLWWGLCFPRMLQLGNFTTFYKCSFFDWCALHDTSNQFASCCVVQIALGILHWINVTIFFFPIHSFKKFFEFINLIGILETKGLKLLRNAKTWWMSMLIALKCVMAKYKGLIVKMHFYWKKTKFVHENLEPPCEL